jgi:hypothetical protein
MKTIDAIISVILYFGLCVLLGSILYPLLAG